MYRIFYIRGGRSFTQCFKCGGHKVVLARLEAAVPLQRAAHYDHACMILRARHLNCYVNKQDSGYRIIITAKSVPILQTMLAGFY